MPRIAPLALLAASVAACGSPAPAIDADAAFVGVNVIPMDTERVLAGRTVLVKGDRIVYVGDPITVSESVAVIDGAGGFLMPALAEMHAHVPGGPTATDEGIERVLTLYTMNGVGTIRGMLGDPRHLALRDRVAAGELFAPTLYTSGPSFNGNTAPTVEAALARVEEQKAAGYDFLKIHPGIARNVMDALAARAGELGIRFAGHVPAGVGLRHMLELAPATIDHLDGYVEALAGEGAPASQWFGVNLMDHVDESGIPALVEATKAAGTWIVPTQILLESSVRADVDRMREWPELRYADPRQVEQWAVANEQLAAAVPEAQRRRFIELRHRLLKALHEGGVPFVLGSDAPQRWNVPGFSIHRELAALVAAGLTPYEALETGTVNVARFLGRLDTAGTVAEGRRADLVLLEASPLDDIANSARIAGVMLGGRWETRAELEATLQ